MPPLSLWRLSWREWRHHPWRHGMALLAVALGVALAWSVHLINASALAEFSAAVRSANGEPDLSLRGAARRLRRRAVRARGRWPRAWPWPARCSSSTPTPARPSGERVALRVLGIDALSIAAIAPTLLPRPARGRGRLRHARPAARVPERRVRASCWACRTATTLALRAGPRWQTLRVAGDVPAAGAALAVMDIAGAQAHFGMAQRLTRIDLRLRARPGPRSSWLARAGRCRRA